MRLKYRKHAARVRLGVIPVVAAVGLLGAVGVATPQAEAQTASISKGELAKLETIVADAKKAPKWVAPGPALNATAALKGKTIVTFPISSNIDACNMKGQQGYFQAEAEKLGAKVISLPTANPGGPPTWINNLNQAINDRASAVVMLCGPTAAAISNELATVQSHHIPVVDGNYNQTGGSKAFPLTGLSAESGVDTDGGITDDLADALVNLKGKPAHILFLDSTDVAQYQGAANTLKADIKKWCPGTCTVTNTGPFTSADWATKEQSPIATALQGNSKINTVIVSFDGMSDDIISDVEAAEKSHPGLKIYAWGGGIAEIHDVNSNPVFAADAGPDERWDAYNQLDQVIRLLSGKKAEPVAKEIAPNMFFTKSNAATFYNGNNYSDKAYSNGAFIKDFQQLWEVG